MYSWWHMINMIEECLGWLKRLYPLTQGVWNSLSCCLISFSLRYWHCTGFYYKTVQGTIVNIQPQIAWHSFQPQAGTSIRTFTTSPMNWTLTRKNRMLVVYSQTRRTSVHMVTYNEMKKERDDKWILGPNHFLLLKWKGSNTSKQEPK